MIERKEANKYNGTSEKTEMHKLKKERKKGRNRDKKYRDKTERKKLGYTKKINTIFITSSETTDAQNIRGYLPLKQCLKATSVKQRVVTYLIKGKMVPLHTMEALWVRGGIAPTLS
jgi:hypothetical protein